MRLLLSVLIVLMTFEAAAPWLPMGETSPWLHEPPAILRGALCRAKMPCQSPGFRAHSFSEFPEPFVCLFCFCGFFFTQGLGTGEQVCLPRPGCVPLQGSVGTWAYASS